MPHASRSLPDVRARGSQSGFAVIAVLLLAAMMTSLVAVSARHALTTDANSPVSRENVERGEAAHAAVQLGRQQLALGESDLGRQLHAGAHDASLQLTELSNGQHAIAVSSLDADGLGATVLAEVVQQALPDASHPDTLPTVSYDVLQDILNDSTIQKHYYAGQASVHDTEIEGLVIVENSSALYLDNVVVHGAIISEDALTGDPFGDFDMATVPCTVLDGTAKIIPGDFLPGVSIVMPDGVLTNTNTSSAVEIHGDVSVYSIDLDGTGAIHGEVAAVNTSLGDVELVGDIHDAEPWSDDLDMQGAFASRTLAFVPRVSQLADVGPIKDFDFGAR